MGGPGKSKTTTRETTLSRTQADILQRREELFEQFFFPEFLEALEFTRDPAFAGPAREQVAEGVSQAFTGAREQLARDVGRRGLEGTGVEARGLTALNIARGRQLQTGLQAAEAERRGERSRLLSLGFGISPQPTTAAPFAQEATARPSLFGIF